MITGVSDFIEKYNVVMEQKFGTDAPKRFLDEKHYYVMDKIGKEVAEFAKTKGIDIDRSFEAKFERWTAYRLETFKPQDKSVRDAAYKIIPEYENDGDTLKTNYLEISGVGKHDIGPKGDQLTEELALRILYNNVGLEEEKILGGCEVTKSGDTLYVRNNERNYGLQLGEDWAANIDERLLILNLREKAKSMYATQLHVSNKSVFELLVEREDSSLV